MHQPAGEPPLFEKALQPADRGVTVVETQIRNESAKVLLVLVGVTPQRRLLAAMRWFMSTAFPSNYATRIINLADTRVTDVGPISPKVAADTACIVRHVREADAIVIATPVYDGLLHDTPASFLCNLPADAVAGKPMGFVTAGGLGNQSVALERQLHSILEWWEPVIVPCGVHLTTANGKSDMLSESAIGDLKQLANALVGLLQVAPEREPHTS